jgi:beta-fructofuranosidase
MYIGQTMNGTIINAEKAVRSAEPVADADPLRPAFHFRPPAQWMNDICGALWHDGWYHIFYQFNPFADRCDWSFVTPCWGHARSRNLILWEHLPIAIAPSVEEGNNQCVSGCATHRADGTPMLFYGHTPLPHPDGTRPPRQQWAALPLDPELRTWQTLDVGLSPGRSSVSADIAGCWTDMFVFREAGRTFAIFKEAGGLVVEAQNSELTRWQAVGRIDGVFGECPNFIKLQDRWLLLRSTYPMTYQVGRFDPERIAFDMDGPAGILDYSYGLTPPPDPSNVNYYIDATGVPVCRFGAPSPAHTDSRGFYATSVFTDSAGRTLLLAWVGAWPSSRGWNCCMSLPRVLSLDAAGRLRQQPIPEMAQLRGIPVCIGPLLLNGESHRIEGFTGDTLETVVDFEIDTAYSVELALCDETGTDAVRVRYNGKSLDANGTILPCVPGDNPCRLKLHLFYDKSVMELFVNDGLQAVTRVAIPPTSILHPEVAAIGGTATLRSMTVWPIKHSKENRLG